MAWTGKSSLNKGKRGERDVVHILNPILAKVCERHKAPIWQMKRNVQQSQVGGFDIDGSDDGSRAGLWWIAIEIKQHAEVAGKINGWWTQTVRQAQGKSGRPDRAPILLYRGNGQKWRCRLWSLVTIDDGPILTEAGKDALAAFSESAGVHLAVAKRRLRVVSDISLEEFLTWFEKRVEVEVLKRLTR